MTTNVIRNQLLEARSYIKEKRYDDAKALLLEIKHPVAFDWLAKLDRIASRAYPSRWYQIWAYAVSRPSRDNFQVLANGHGISFVKASLWIFASSTFCFLIVLGLWVLPSLINRSQITGSILLVIAGMCTVIGAGSVVYFWVTVGITQLLALLSGGSGNYTKLGYVTAAFTAPYTMLVGGLALISVLMASLVFNTAFGILVICVLGIAWIFVVLYSVALNVIALRAVNGIGIVKAFFCLIIGTSFGNVLLDGGVKPVVDSLTMRLVIEGPSMQPTFYTGQVLMINRLAYEFADPQRDDIVIFNAPNTGPDEPPYIKRVIGLPGQRVEIRDTKVYVDGKVLDEPYLKESCDPGRYPNRTWQLGQDEFFMLGDNRNHSSDSRAFNAVQRDLIIGKAQFIYWPLSDIRVLD